MEEKKLVPKLRFPGFTEPWEQRKLSSLTEYIGTGKSRFVIKEFGEYAILGSTNVIGYDDAYDYDGNFILTARVGANAGQLYQYSGKVKITDNTVFLMSDRSQFIYYALTHFDLRRLSFGTGQPLVKSSELQKLKLCVPVSKSEQEKIGEIFNNIDNLITLHQRKLEHLKLKKKSLLQKLFPKEGEVYPELRFPGFTDPWEQRKFLDLLDAQNGIRRGPFGSALKKESFVKESDYVVYEQQNAIYDNYKTRYFISKEKYTELIRFNIQPGDFIMSGAGTIGRISMAPGGIKKGVFNQALIRFKVDKDSVNPLYFLKFMQSDMMQKQLTQANPGSAMTNLVPMDELKKWDIVIPSLEEQNKISTFINQLDDVITLHQRKLEHLQLLKKALLQQLFV